MKKYVFLSIILALSLNSLNGQVQSAGTVDNSLIINSSAFLDASNFSYNPETSLGEENNLHKGLIFPTVDLVNFEFVITDVSGMSLMGLGGIFPTMFNGMIVYNAVTGTTLTNVDGSVRSSTATEVVPGFYYFHNPRGILLYLDEIMVPGLLPGNAAHAVSLGEWRPLGGAGGAAPDNAWIVGGNVKTAGAPQILGVSAAPTNQAPPIIVYAGVGGERRAIMHIGRPAPSAP